MSLRVAWLILIAGVSLLQYSLAVKFELDEHTCNQRNAATKVVEGLQCFVRVCRGNNCMLYNEQEGAQNRTILSTTEVVLGLRPLKNSDKLLVVLQLRGSKIKFDKGIEIVTRKEGNPDSSEIKKARCYVDKGQPKAEIPGGNRMNLLRMHATPSLLVCELILKNFLDDSEQMNSEAHNIRLNFEWHSPPKDEPTLPWVAISDVKKEFTYSEVCQDEFKLANVPGHYIRPVFSWMNDVTCQTSIDTEEGMGSRFKLMVEHRYHKMIEAERVWCSNAHYKYKLKNDVREYDLDSKIAVCALKVCSLCEQPTCTETNCPTYVKGDRDNCATLKCDKLYSMDGKPPIATQPTCEKSDDDKSNWYQFDFDKIERGFVDTVVWKTGDDKGTAASKIKCYSSRDCPASLKVGRNSTKEIVITADKVECKDMEKILNYINTNGDQVKLTEVVCDRKAGKWKETRTNGRKENFLLESELECEGEKVIVEKVTVPTAPSADAAAAQAEMPFLTIGAGVGGIGILVIIILVIVCCLCLSKKKKESPPRAPIAFSSKDVYKKSSSDSGSGAAVNTPQAPVIVMPMTLQDKGSKEKESASDKTKKKNTKKSDKKKELLKFEDSNNISDSQAKKNDETEKIDILQQEAEKLKAKEKKAKNKKELLKKYPKLATLDESSTNQSEERGSRKQDEPSIAREHEKISQKEPMADESSKMTASKKINKIMETADISVKPSAGNKDLQALLDNRLDDMEKLTNRTAILKDSKDVSQRRPSTQRKKKNGRTPNKEPKEKSKSQLASDESGALNQSKTDEETDVDATNKP